MNSNPIDQQVKLTDMQIAELIEMITIFREALLDNPAGSLTNDIEADICKLLEHFPWLYDEIKGITDEINNAKGE